MNRDIIVIGHKNPDTDSICSAIAYAYLKNATSEEKHVPMRAGDINPETQYVLDYFKVKAPEYIGDVRAQIGDGEIIEGAVAHEETSLRAAWNLLHDNKAATLTVVDDDNRMKGIVSVGDIARFFITDYEECVITEAGTLCGNIVETVEGRLLTGDMTRRFESGQVRVATVSPDVMCQVIDEGDIVVMADKKDAQLCAIQQNAACIVVCLGVEVDDDVLAEAEKHGCAVIATANDSYTTARLLNQSVPVKFLMISDGIMSYTKEDFVDEVKVAVADTRHREFPIVDGEGKYQGVLKRRNLLDVRKKKMILIDHNEMEQAVKGAKTAEILELVDHHKIGNVQTLNPVFYRNRPVGCTSTIIYGMYREAGVDIPKDIAGVMLSAILSDTLLFRSPTCTPLDVEAGEALAEIAGVEVRSYALDMFSAGSDFGSKTDEEIFNMDYKRFSAGGVSYGVGQVSSVNRKELDSMKERMLDYMNKVLKEGSVDMVYLMMTDILEESSDLLCAGPGALKTAAAAFGVEEGDRSVYLKGAVSRKKQIIPQITAVLTR